MIDIELPEFIEGETIDTVMQRMLDALPDDIDKSEGSYIWDALAPVANEYGKIIEWAREILRIGSISTTYGEYLDLKAAENGIIRTPSTKATGKVTVVGEPGTTVPAGTRFATPSDNVTESIEFESTEDVVIGESGEAAIDVIAVEEGAQGNVEAGNISLVIPAVNGVTAVNNKEAMSGGYEEESDESLLQRVLEDSRKTEGDGNVDDYIAWSKEISGVGNVLVEPQWQGPGTVRVVILDQNGNAASEDLIDAVQEHLDPGQKGIGEGKAPVGAKVTVETAKVILIETTIPDITAESGYSIEQAKENAEKALKEYLNSINPGGEIIVKEAEAVIINAPGVRKFGDLLLNGSREDILISTTELADLGRVVFT